MGESRRANLDAVPPGTGGGAPRAPEIRVTAEVPGDLAAVLAPEALAFLGRLAERFQPTRRRLLEARTRFRDALLAGRSPGFLSETREIRESSWRVASPPADLEDRRVEITGPVDRKTVINGLNSGARVFMADFEDAHSPTWEGTLRGQANLFDAVRSTIGWTSPDGREYRLRPPTATLMVRPRGWHLPEGHVTVDGEPISASLFDFGLFAFHNARALVERGTGPYYYLPKLEHHPEAELWNEVFTYTESELGLSFGTIRATVLIETLPAAFEMEEILYALRSHSAGLNGGRWDYIFSFIKQFREDPTRVFPDRASLPMTAPFLDAYSRLMVETCHRRGAHAIGGMAAQIPIKDDPAANARAIGLVVADKEREIGLGFDGTWVAHPGLVAPVRAVFDRGMARANQVDRPPADRSVAAPELLQMPAGAVTPEGVRTNVRAAFRYLAAWLDGVGCVPIDHRMEDAATVEIARAQLWQWIHYGSSVSGDGPMTPELFRGYLASERSAYEAEPANGSPRNGSVAGAAAFLDHLVTTPDFPEFFTLEAYPMLDQRTGNHR